MSATGPGFCAGNFTRHGLSFPSPTVVATTTLSCLMVTFSPASAQPQKINGTLLCTTMLLPITVGNMIAAGDDESRSVPSNAVTAAV